MKVCILKNARVNYGELFYDDEIIYNDVLSVGFSNDGSNMIVISTEKNHGLNSIIVKLSNNDSIDIKSI